VCSCVVGGFVVGVIGVICVADGWYAVDVGLVLLLFSLCMVFVVLMLPL